MLRTSAARVARFFSTAAALCASLWIAGCTSFDPYNVIQRQNNPHNQSGGDEWSFTPSAQATQTQRRAAIDFVWQTVLDRYYRVDFNGVDWAGARRKWEPIALAAESDEAFWEALDQMTGELADAHTRVESPIAVMRRRAQVVQSLGIGVRLIDDELVVTSVNRDSDAFWAGVRGGMTLRQIGDNDALAQWRAWQGEARKSSTPQAAARLPLRRLTAIAERSAQGGVKMVFERDAAESRLNSSRVERIDTFVKLRPSSTRPALTHRVLPSGVGYLSLSAFSESLRAPLLAAVTELKGTPAIILDLRGNAGGSAAMSEALVGAFFKTKTLIGRTFTRTGEPISLAFGAIKFSSSERFVPGRRDAYTGNVVVLIDAGSASAAEAVAAALQSTGRATVVGETSCGCLLAYMGYASVPGGGELAYSEIGFSTAKGEVVEGRGVVPDVAVLAKRIDFAAQRDRALEVAVSRALP